MPRLPQVKYRTIEKILFKKGFRKRTTKSGHVVFRHSDGRHTVVPHHTKPLTKGTLRAVLRQANVSLEDFLGLV